jgi:hypothetical protein
MNIFQLSLVGSLAIVVAFPAIGADGKAEYDRRAAAELVQLFERLDLDDDRALSRNEAQGNLTIVPLFPDIDVDGDDIATIDELARHVERSHGIKLDVPPPQARRSDAERTAAPR